MSFRTVLREGDLEAITALVIETGVFSEAEVGIARELVEASSERGPASGYHFLMADSEDGLDGYACFGPIEGTFNRFELYWIAVAARAQRSGLAARLQKATEEGSRALGGVMLVAETSTRADYTPARKFYVAQGYHLAAEVPDWHDDGDGLAIYVMRL